MKQGDIILIDVPFNSFSGSKIRPALIVSNDHFNNGMDIILAAISTKENGYSYSLDQKDLLIGRLHQKSYIKFSNIFSFEKKHVIRNICSLKKDVTKDIIEKLISNFTPLFLASGPYPFAPR